VCTHKLSVSLVISAQFTLEMCAAAENYKKIKNLYIGGSRSFKVIDVYIMKKLVTSASYDKQYVCAYLQMPSR